MIQVQGLSHHFGPLQVLKDVWFDVPQGSVFGFIGPNGAGKTTALRVMATLLEPAYGRVLIDGYDVVEKPTEVRRLMGFMPDGFGVYERVTVHEYLEFFAASFGIGLGGRAKAIGAVEELTELGGLRDRLVSSLSKGMKQRLAIARTLLHDPKVMILDEPANGLDPRARIEMRDLILHLQALGKTVLLSSHILTELGDMVSDVAILEKGTLKAAGSMEEMVRRLQGQRRVHLQFMEPVEAPPAPLRAVPGVLEVEREAQRTLAATFEGGDEVVAALVRASVEAGLSVVRVEPERDDLEQVFLQATQGELQ